LIQEDDDIDKKIKKRDETIYIKNYYQPMLYDSLKNLLSLNEEEDKLAFTLSFKVNANGFIDYRTVQFHKNIINIEKNLSHERI
jgi:exoribonuclease R